MLPVSSPLSKEEQQLHKQRDGLQAEISINSYGTCISLTRDRTRTLHVACTASVHAAIELHVAHRAWAPIQEPLFHMDVPGMSAHGAEMNKRGMCA